MKIACLLWHVGLFVIIPPLPIAAALLNTKKPPSDLFYLRLNAPPCVKRHSMVTML